MEVFKGALKQDNYDELLSKIFQKMDLGRILKQQKKIIIKPNLVIAKPSPCTTDVRCVAAIVRFCQENTNGEIIIAEGSGGEDTGQCFRVLGYEKLAAAAGIKLIDLDDTPAVKLTNPDAYLYKEIYLPEIVLEGFFISVPALKDHSITKVTLSLKNMIGIMPAKYYSGYWSYKKSEVHRYDVEKAIVDLLSYRRIDLSVIDGRIGQKRCHLSGPPCYPPKNMLIAGTDPVAVDSVGAHVLGWEPQAIDHIVYAQKKGFGVMACQIREV